MDSRVWSWSAQPYAYWLLRFNATPLALIVEWVVRGREAQVRVGVQSVHRPRVWHRKGAVTPSPEMWVRVGDMALGPSRTFGCVEGLTWDMHITPLGDFLSLASGQLLGLASFPAVRFEGSLTFRGEQWQGTALGSIAHMWGWRSPRRWFWCNAASFSVADTFVETWLLDCPLPLPWPRMQVGYFWARVEGREYLLRHPLRARITVDGLANAPRVRATPWHGEGHLLLCRSHPKTWQKPEPRLINTLTADARFLGGPDCFGQAALAWREPPVY